MGSLSIVPATADRLPVLADVLARAFADDPMIRWPMVDAPDTHPRIARFFAGIYAPLIDDGNLWEAGDGAGFAHWVPPGSASAALETHDELAATSRRSPTKAVRATSASGRGSRRGSRTTCGTST